MSGAKKSSTNLEAIKAQLLERKKELEEELAALSAERVGEGEVQDIGDQALSSTMERLRISLQDTEFNEYQRIIKALEMVENGTYGICVDCEQPIAAKRLELYPNAMRCLVCQEEFEERQGT